MKSGQSTIMVSQYRVSGATQSRSKRDKINTKYNTVCSLCFFCCVFFPFFHSGHQVRWTYQPGSHRIFHPPSFCGACLHFFSREGFSLSFSLVDRQVESCVLTIQSFSTCWAFYFIFSEKKSRLPGSNSQRVRRLRGYL